MRRLGLILAATAALALAGAPAAHAAFGFEDFRLGFSNANGTPTLQAGSHPFAVTTDFTLNNTMDPNFGQVPDEQLKSVRVQLPEGLVGDTTAVPACTNADFINVDPETHIPGCSDDSAVGVINIRANYNSTPGIGGSYISAPVYSLEPPPGSVQKFGFFVKTIPIALDFKINPNPPYNVIAFADYIAQPLPVIAQELTIWGVPASPLHDRFRGHCIANGVSPIDEIQTTGEVCPSASSEKAFLTLPRACTGSLTTTFNGESWLGTLVKGSSPTEGLNGCGKLGFAPSISAKPTSQAASSPTGLAFSLDVKDEGLTNPTGLAQSDIKKAVVTLPDGFSINASLAEGLAACSQTDLARESVDSAPGVGCPNASKIGTVEVETPLVEESISGSLYTAEPYKNEFGSLFALYLVIKNPKLGIIVKQAIEVSPDPKSGQLTATSDNIPQLPFSHFKLHFREGARTPLASPPSCGTYNAEAQLTPWAGGAPVNANSLFQIVAGPDGGACLNGPPPLHPKLTAGTVSNSAGRYAPFYLRLARTDAEQELSRFSVKLPPGVVGKLAGVSFCPKEGIDKARSREHGGQAALELASPSCPKSSELGHTLAGAGVGPTLTYVPGKVYLAGPYRGASLSMVAITAAKVGPFDLGTAVVRFALKIDPETAEVTVDSSSADPLPRIIEGVPVHLRDIRTYVDRSDFVLNPTSCDREQSAATVFGMGLNLLSPADDQSAVVSDPFQAADCARRGFEPRLALSLKGGTKRGDNPKFKAVLRPRPGDANIGRAQVTLPHSEFLDQSHIKTICTRVQFAQGSYPGEKCPAASIYGYAKATTPLLDEQVKGPVYLRSSNHNLPDLVAALHSPRLDFNLVGRIDSVKNGRIRNTFETAPDAPVSRFVLEMQGGKKGLLVNSTDICKHKNRAIAAFTGDNAKVHTFKPVLRATSCGSGGEKRG